MSLEGIMAPFLAPMQFVFSALSIIGKIMMLIPTPCIILIGFAIGCLIIRILF